MTQTPKDGGPAFPLLDSRIGWNANLEQLERGLTLRDWFAGQALAGLLATNRAGAARDFAETAFRQADAMLAERERRQ